jgi:hypothetical protein
MRKILWPKLLIRKTEQTKASHFLQDGSVSHFCHRAIKAYSSDSWKHRKIFNQDFDDFCSHKTGKTRHIFLDEIQIGCKKIMLLYLTPLNRGKAPKINWVVHQYHIGREGWKGWRLCYLENIL